LKLGLGTNFKDGLSEGEGGGVGEIFQQENTCDPKEKPVVV
jgi:hypothetical protein